MPLDREARASFTAEQNQDGEWFCTGCGTSAFRYEESVVCVREMRENGASGLSFDSEIGDQDDGSDAPGIVCTEGHVIVTEIPTSFVA